MAVAAIFSTLKAMKVDFPRRLVSTITLASMLLAACEIEFTPQVTPLVLSTAPPQPFGDEVSKPETQIESLPTESAPEEAQFTSLDAIQLCGSNLSWGDGTMGICLAPGGESYFAWTGPNEVMALPVDPNDPNQLGFIQAVIASSGDMSSVVEGRRNVGLSAAGLFVTLIGLPFACILATLVGCIIDGAAVLVTAGLVAEARSSFTDASRSFESNSTQAEYYFCRMQGNPDLYCRNSAGPTP